MITEDKVFRKLKKTPIFCIADDLYNVGRLKNNGEKVWRF